MTAGVEAAGTFRSTGSLAEAVNRLLRPKLESLGKNEAENIRQDISIRCVAGRHSPPGHPPYAEEFKLYRSVDHRVINRGDELDVLELRAQRTSDSGDPKVAIYLEKGTRRMAARPFLARSVARLAVSTVSSLAEP